MALDQRPRKGLARFPYFRSDDNAYKFVDRLDKVLRRLVYGRAAMIRRTALALAVACVAAAPAYADDVCSGVIWKVTGAIRRLNNGGGTMYAKDVVELEIGHGLYQCSVRGRRNVERVLATCRLGEMCTLRAKIVTPFNPDTAGRSLIIKPRDRILSVRRGADDDNGEAGK